jgi:hypothetical protein
LLPIFLKTRTGVWKYNVVYLIQLLSNRKNQEKNTRGGGENNTGHYLFSIFIIRVNVYFKKLYFYLIVFFYFNFSYVVPYVGLFLTYYSIFQLVCTLLDYILKVHNTGHCTQHTVF